MSCPLEARPAFPPKNKMLRSEHLKKMHCICNRNTALNLKWETNAYLLQNTGVFFFCRKVLGTTAFLEWKTNILALVFNFNFVFVVALLDKRYRQLVFWYFSFYTVSKCMFGNYTFFWGYFVSVCRCDGQRFYNSPLSHLILNHSKQCNRTLKFFFFLLPE